MTLPSRTRWIALLLTAGCASPPPPVTVPAPAPADVTWSLFLVGDAGSPHLPDDPTLRALTADAQSARGRGTIIYLGDNVYPSGLRDSSDPGRTDDEAVLRALLSVGQAAGVATIMIPGNHDWQWGGERGWAGVQRADGFIRREGGPGAESLPGGGCPGPAVRDAGPFRVVALDTEWWLHDRERPPAGGSTDCTPGTPDAVVAALRAVLDSAGGKPVIVVAHHPLRSGGKHGGHFTWRQHIFPLVDAAPWAWLPLPIIGSAYPVSRQLGISRQDVSGSAYGAMLEAMHGAMNGVEPLVWASGHDHSLQVLSGQPLQLVSGTGSTDHGEAVATIDSTRFASSGSGWMRLDAVRDGRIRLAVMLAGDGIPQEAWSDWLSPAAPAPSR